MDYNLEALGDERFQKLAQALLTKTFPNVQSLPVGQPDGGRDAFLRHSAGFVVFQVKFSRQPSNKDERIAVADVIKTEGEKVARLITKGATAFYLITNVSGTAHLDAGSIDRLNAELSAAFGIPSFCWWRDDIERRIEAADGLIWRYPEIFRGSDFLEVLASGKMRPLPPAKTATFRAYVAAQYIKEADVRFQQVQIQNKLLDLFTDTPIGTAREKVPSSDVCAVPARTLAMLASTVDDRHYAQEEGGETLAADWLLSIAPEDGLQRIVLEGAPGQGKSTVTQYVAQLQRMRSLRKDADIAKVAKDHLGYAVRLPIRVDLRDYATWITGNDPFANEKDVKRPATGLDSLESFLAHQIYTLSGGREFSVDDLLSTLNDSHLLLILDGFDEVADKGTRARLIEQIRSSSERLQADCRSIQVIVTSRPAAFILSPGFPEREWLHLSLLPMKIKQIGKYTDKWIAARSFNSSEGKAFKDLLLDRVSKSHIRSLAQNPMQLAILLALISTKGRSLPDKRTALYDSYMDLFFGREAEKDETVRENRDVLLQIHQYVAWTLQVDAERPGGSGSISQAELETLVRNFLTMKEHRGDVLRLFTGVVERVGALVSRVQGMLEFEVQPLREYFSGRFLYESAPYSPPGNEKKGTRPQRFDALARRPYWLNVARFYAGCYNSGELSSLVSGLLHLAESSSLALRSHVLQLSLHLLNDWVFAQEPRTVKEVIRFIASDVNLRLVVASRSSWEDQRLSLPEKSGRNELAARARQAFGATNEPAYLRRLGSLLRWNANLDSRWEIWEDLRNSGKSGLLEAAALGLFHEASGSSLRRLVDQYGDEARLTLLAIGRWDSMTDDDRSSAINAFAKAPVSAVVHLRNGRSIESDVHLYRVYLMLSPNSYRYLLYEKASQDDFENVWVRYGLLPFTRHDNQADSSSPAALADLISASHRAVRVPLNFWRTSLDPWADVVESARRTWGDLPRLYCLAAIGAGIKSKEERGKGFSDVFDSNRPLVHRARYARLKPSINWWQDALHRADSSDKKLWIGTLLFAWGPRAVIESLSSQCQQIVDALSEREWKILFSNVNLVISSTLEARQPFSGWTEDTFATVKSARLKSLLLLRLPRGLSVKALTRMIAEFDGKDREIGAFLALRGMNEAYREPKMWKDLMPFFKEHGEHLLLLDAEQTVEADIYYYNRADDMPTAVVDVIATDPDAMPLSVLEVAETSSSRRPRGESESLGGVAERESWFS